MPRTDQYPLPLASVLALAAAVFMIAVCLDPRFVAAVRRTLQD